MPRKSLTFTIIYEKVYNEVAQCSVWSYGKHPYIQRLLACEFDVAEVVDFVDTALTIPH